MGDFIPNFSVQALHFSTATDYFLKGTKVNVFWGENPILFNCFQY